MLNDTGTETNALPAAETARHRPDGTLRRPALRLRILRGVALSYAINALLAGLAAYVGIVSGWSILFAITAGLLHYVVFQQLYKYGWAERGKDSFLALPQALFAFAVVLGIFVFWPPLSLYVLLVLPLIFCFGMLGLRWPTGIAMWVLVSAGLVWALAHNPAPLSLAMATLGQRLFTYSYFSAMLLCYVGVGLLGSELRLTLYRRNRSLAAATARIEQLASHDELTGALTRRAVTAQLDLEAQRATRRDNALAVALLDLDHFKAVNDCHGHAAGDAVLRGFVELVASATRSIDVFGRYGGEEFLLVLIDTPDDAAMNLLERIRHLVEEREWTDAAPGVRITVSAGLARHIQGESVAELIRRADKALYAAKDAGRNRVMLAD